MDYHRIGYYNIHTSAHTLITLHTYTHEHILSTYTQLIKIFHMVVNTNLIIQECTITMVITIVMLFYGADCSEL